MVRRNLFQARRFYRCRTRTFAFAGGATGGKLWRCRDGGATTFSRTLIRVTFRPSSPWLGWPTVSLPGHISPTLSGSSRSFNSSPHHRQHCFCFFCSNVMTCMQRRGRFLFTMICSYTDHTRTWHKYLLSFVVNAYNDFHYQTSITFGIEATEGLAPAPRGAAGLNKLYLFSVWSDLYILVAFGVRNPRGNS